jgi:SAM-dependent methyltransferase
VLAGDAHAPGAVPVRGHPTATAVSRPDFPAVANTDVLAVPAPNWTRFTLAHPAAAELPDDIVFGACIPTESELKLIGDMSGKRVLELGCGAGHNAIRLARAGAKVIAIDASADQLALARAAAEEADVKVELHHGDLHELAWLRADGIDMALSAYGLASVTDLPRVLRQVHRVLRQEAALVLSLPHPALEMVAAGAADPLRIRRTWFDHSPRPWTAQGATGTDHPRTIAEVFTALTRNNYRVDTIAEPEASHDRGPASSFADVMRWIPPTVIIRGRKQGN